jgi:glycine reductase
VSGGGIKLRLNLGKIYIKDVQFGAETEVRGTTLYVNKNELKELILQDKNFTDVNIEIAKPGEEVRIVPVKDVIEPRVKVAGPGSIFPGFIGSVEKVGSGITHALSGCAVVTTGKIVGFQEGIIDMTGVGAQYTPYSRLNNIVLDMEPRKDITPHEHERSVRLAGLKAASYLGKAGRDIKPHEIKTFETIPFTKTSSLEGLPRVVYIYMVVSQGLLHDTYIYGVNARQILPTFISPTEVMDGAIVSGNCVSPGSKTTTYIHQNNPIIEELYKVDGKELNFVGVIITNENPVLEEKIRSSHYMTKLVELLGADGAIISSEGFGNPTTDLMMNCRNLESIGVKTVLLSNEDAGKDGRSEPLPDGTPEADAIISAGNSNAVIKLPPMKKVIGRPEVLEIITGGFAGNMKEDGSLEVEIHAMMGVHNEIGFFNFSAEEI